MESYRKRGIPQTWHDKAWLYNDEIGEIGFAHDYVRDALSRVRPYAGIRPEPHEAPIPLADALADPEASTRYPGLTDKVAAIADELVARLHPADAFMGDTAHQLDITGDCHVALVPDPEDETAERMYVLSVDELRVKEKQWQYRITDADTWINIDRDASTVFRVWTPHGRFHERATSPMRRMLGVCEELLLLTREIRGTALSRIAVNGILFVNEQMTILSATGAGDADTEGAGDGENDTDPFIDDLIAYASASMQDPDSAAGAVPLVIRGPGTADEMLKHIPFARPFDAQSVTMRAELLGRVGNGLNLPREVVLGMGSTNHWNDEQIDDQTWRIHLESRARRVCSASTEGYLYPGLTQEEVDPVIARRIVQWYDPSEFLGDPDLSDDADGAHDRMTISDEAHRRYKGFKDTDAPSDEEIAARLARDPFSAGPPEPVEDDEGEKPAEEDDDEPVEEEAVAAAARPRTSSKLGRRLVAIERDTRTRIQAEADAALRRVLEKAGMQVRNAASKRAANRALADQIRDVAVALIPSTLGAAAIRALGLAEEEILDTEFTELRGRWHRIVTRAQVAAMEAAAREVQAQFDEEAFVADTEDDRDQGWLIFATGLAVLARARMFTPSPEPPPVGEFDDTMIVPAGLVRASLDRAGGAQVEVGPSGPRAVASQSPGPGGPPAAGGATAGPSMLDLFRQSLGILADEYEWVYGAEPRRTFEPHAALDGTTFAAWDDPVLAAEAGEFPFVVSYRPGDHAGCRCDFAVNFTQEEPTP